DDWSFRTEVDERKQVSVDLYLNNGQRAILEIHPLLNPYSGGEQVPEVIVRCEMSGERPDHPSETRRWLSRAPDKSCEWSSVELSESLVRQINARLASAQAAPPAVAA
ncbi:MAG: hypothetical protein AB1705_14045, partial [Verrucomicrobiota bacterium]